MVRVIPEIANQKNRRSPKGRDHADLVGKDALVADENIAQGQEDGAGGIERSVQGGKIGKVKDHPLSLQFTVGS